MFMLCVVLWFVLRLVLQFVRECTVLKVNCCDLMYILGAFFGWGYCVLPVLHVGFVTLIE